MASNENQEEVVQANTASALSPQDVKDIQTFNDYATKNEKKMKDLIIYVDKKWKIGLWWDAKVSDDDWHWYHCLSLFKVSNKEDMKAEIQKYVEFYQKMVNAVSGIHSDEVDKQRVSSHIAELLVILTELVEAAENGKKITTSSIVYKQHKEFILKKEKLENLMKSMKCISLEQANKAAVDNFQTAVGKVEDLTVRAEVSEKKYERLLGSFETLLSINEALVEQNKVLAKDVKDLKMKIGDGDDSNSEADDTGK